MVKENFGRLVEIMKSESLSLKGKILKTRFEFPKFDNFCVKYLGCIGPSGSTKGGNGYIYGFGPNQRLVYFKEFDFSKSCMDEFIEGTNEVAKYYSN